MKLAVPLSAPGEAAILYEAGATEFYCGVQPQEWQDLYGNHDSISRRQGAANLATLDELNLLVKETAGLGAPLFLTVNGNYTEEQLLTVLSIIDSFEEMGGTGIMIADIALLSLLKKRGSKLVRGLSLLAAVSNLSAMEFYFELGVSRVVFPRFLTTEQINAIMIHYPNVQAECIVWLDKCKFIDGYCRFIHSIGYQHCGDLEYTDVPESRIKTYDMDYRLPACFELFGNSPLNPACAACGLPALERAGVSIFKLGGRGRPLDVRLSGIRFLRESRKLANAGEIKNLYETYFGSPCSNDICYLWREGDNG